MVEEWVSLREFGRRREVSLQAVQKAIASGRVTAVRRAEPGPEGQPGRILAIEVNAATQQWNRNTDPTEAAKSGKVIPGPSAPQPVAPMAETPTAQPSQPSLLIADAPEPPGAPAGGSGNQAPGTRPADATPKPAPETVAAAAVGLTDAPDSRPPSRHDAPPGRGDPVAGDVHDADALNQVAVAPPPDAATEPPPAADTPANSEYYAHRSKREEFAAKSAEMDYLAKIGVLVPAATVRKIVFDAARALRDSMLSIPDRTSPLLAAERDPVRVHAIQTAELTRTLNGFTGRLARSLDELTRGSAAAGGPGLSE